VVSGGEFGWRTGSGKWPAYQPDSLPAAVEIGPGSPTGIAFGSGSQFPEKYRRALFLSDWSFGNLYAVHLTPHGASYDGIAEPFVTAAPLPITDLVVRPQDGMLYFTVGGRGLESALYRVWYAANENGKEMSPSAEGDTPPAELRRRLETLHRPGADLREAAKIVERAWPQLAHPDRHVRFAARIALEHQPLTLWQERAVAETNPRALIHAAIGLTRSCDGPDADWQEKLIAALFRIDWSALSEEDRIGLVRAYQLALIRLGPPSELLRKKLIERLGPLYPAESPSLNRELCGLLVALRGPKVISKTLKLVRNAGTQEEQIHYMFCLRLLSAGWKMSERAEYFEWFELAHQYRGGVSFDSFTDQIRKEAIKTLSSEEKQALGDLGVDRQVTSLPLAAANRTVVRNWTVDELLSPTTERPAARDFLRGEALFAAASCFRCHRMAGRGGTIGPDLTGAGRRFTARDLLEAIVEPSRVISDQYRSTVFTLSDGKTLTGHIADLEQGELSVITDMLRPRDYTQINRGKIEEMSPSPVSMMPAGLLDTLSLEEILDLLAYLRSGADRSDPVFAPEEG
jgi:putative heme-binding domain-containing protein